MGGSGYGRTITNNIEAVAATFPPTVAVPWPLPAVEPSWSSLDRHFERVPGYHLTPKTSLVNATEERHGPAEAGVAE